MSNNEINPVHVTEEGILLFPQVFTPKKVKDRRGKETGDPIYSASLLLTPEAAKATWARIVEIAREHFGDDVDMKALRTPIEPGAKAKAAAEAKNKDGSFYEGKVVLKARSKHPTGIMDGSTQEDIIAGTSAAKRVRSGNYAHFEVTLRAYDAVEDDAKPGVKAYLNHVLITRDGKPIAGKTTADAFSGILSRRSSAEVSVPDLDDGIPY